VRVVVVGATGNVGTSLLEALAVDKEVESIVGVARRRPAIEFPKTEFVAADCSRDDLVPVFCGADAVVHLAWLIQPGRDLAYLNHVNIGGSERVFRAVVDAGVPSLVYASSVGAYSPGPKNRTVDERWPTNGIRTSYYSRQKAAVERILDRFERERREARVVRLRPGLIFKRESAAGQRRLFIGPLFPPLLARHIPVVPDIPRLRFQAVHSHDVGEAYRQAVRSDVRGAFNIATEPVLDPDVLARILGVRKLPVPAAAARWAAQLTFKLHLQPSDVGWLDLALQTPLLDSTRARDELGWGPRRSSEDAVRDLVTGLGEDAGFQTPPLERRARTEELASGVGEREVG
jgi:UDP-glucose 4-epimerase